MQETAKSARVFRFGVFEVDAATGELRKQGLRIRMQDQPAQFLLILLNRAGEVVSRDEIRRKLWPPDTFVDFDQGLGASLRKLRQALGDDAETPRYIETIPKQGFRFVAPVERISSVPQGATAVLPIRALVPPTPEAHREFPQTQRHVSTWWAVLAVACVLSFFLGWLLHIFRAAPVGLRVSTYTKITYDGVPKTLIGSDGSRLYFDATWSDSIGQVAVTGGAISTIPVPIPYFAFPEDVSQDGSNFLIATNEKGFVLDRPQWNFRVPGGSLRRLPDGGGAAFSPDGNSVAFQTAKGELWAARSDGSGAQKLVSGQSFPSLYASSADGSTRYFSGRVAWSPDGSQLRFGSHDRLWEVSSSGANLHEVIPGWHLSSSQCCGSWTPDGRFFVFLDITRGPIAQPEIWALSERRGLFPRSPAQPVQLTTGPIGWGQPIPGRDGKKIFATGNTHRGALSRFDQRTGQFLPFLGGISAHFVSFSKDGQFVAYVSYPEGVLWRANRDGTNPVQLTDPPINAMLPRWSPDGSQILFMDFSVGQPGTFVVAARGGSPQRLLPEDHEALGDANWSADGRKVVFSTAGPFNRKGNLRILDLATHQVAMVSGSDGIYSPRWSPDGRCIAAMPVDATGLKIFDLESQQWSELVRKDTQGTLAFPSWSRDGKFIYFTRIAANGDKGIFRIRAGGGDPERVANLKSIDLGGFWGWMGLDPGDAPLVLRDTGSNDIYALTVEEK
jgi:DNA-binding winged helix-turn-helix (wHTH) protein/Tol biopolymer transport system component